MAEKTKHYLMYDNEVPVGTTVDMTPVIPSGKVVTIKKFGGFDPAVGDNKDSIIALQWGSGTTWTTIKAGGKCFEFDMQRDFIGDGSKRFRLVRVNRSAQIKIIVAWLEALVHDV